MSIGMPTSLIKKSKKKPLTKLQQAALKYGSYIRQLRGAIATLRYIDIQIGHNDNAKAIRQLSIKLEAANLNRFNERRTQLKIEKEST